VWRYHSWTEERGVRVTRKSDRGVTIVGLQRRMGIKMPGGDLCPREQQGCVLIVDPFPSLIVFDVSVILCSLCYNSCL